MISAFRDVLGRILGRRPVVMQVAALCVDPASGKFLLITGRGAGRWLIPKGWPMPGRSLGGAALQEAWEEAGVRGTAADNPVGCYRYEKNAGRRLCFPIDVQVYIITVDSLAKNFPERGQRRRRWFTPPEAARLIGEEGLRRVMLSAFQ